MKMLKITSHIYKTISNQLYFSLITEHMIVITIMQPYVIGPFFSFAESHGLLMLTKDYVRGLFDTIYNECHNLHSYYNY